MDIIVKAAAVQTSPVLYCREGTMLNPLIVPSGATGQLGESASRL